MNSITRRAVARLAALSLLALTFHLPVSAANLGTCDLNNNVDDDEQDGGSDAFTNAATACGVNNIANGDRTNAFGFDNQINGDDSNAFGSGNILTGGFNQAFGTGNAISMGSSFSNAFGIDNFLTLTHNAVVLGIGNQLGNGQNLQSATAVGQFNAVTADRGVAIGFSTMVTGMGGLAIGGWADLDGNDTFDLDTDTDGDANPDASSELTRSMGTHAIAIGGAAWATGERAVAIGIGSQAIAVDSVAIGTGSIADRVNTVSVGAVGAERQIVNVAAGTELTDAVNLQQLQATLATANAYTDTAVATGSTQANAYTDNREAAIRGDMEAGDAATLSAANQHADEGDAATLSAANAYTDSKFADVDFSGINDRFDAIENRLGRQDARIDRNGAMAAAMMNMGTNIAGSNSKRGKLAVGVGFQGQRQAVSIGYGKKVGERTSFSLSGAFSGGESSAGLGIGVEL